MKTCVVIPTYNEAKAIESLIKQILSQGLDVLVVDDGSDDNTAQLAGNCGATVLRNPINSGKGTSLIRGFNYCLDKGFEAVITMDGDGQHLPSDIPNFMRQAEHSDNLIFIGNRMSKTDNMPLLRILTNRFMSWFISNFIHQRIPDTQCGFRLIKKDALKSLKLKTSKYEIESEILIKASSLRFKIESVPIQTVYTKNKSQIHPILDTIRFIKFIFRI